MCVAVSVKRGDNYEYCETVQELANELKIDPSKIRADNHHCCLCNVDLKLFGIVKNPDTEEWWPEYFIELEPLPTTQGA